MFSLVFCYKRTRVKRNGRSVCPQTSRLRNSQDATVTEMRAKSERTAARLRAETQAFETEKVGIGIQTVA